jgi:hypothetical protein
VTFHGTNDTANAGAGSSCALAAIALAPLSHSAAAQIFGAPVTPTGSWLVTDDKLCRDFAPSYIRIDLSETARWIVACEGSLASGVGTLVVKTSRRMTRKDATMDLC